MKTLVRSRTSRSSTSACRASPTTSPRPAAAVTHLSWAPPAGADAALGWTLADLVGDSAVDEANALAYEPLPRRPAAPG